MRWRGEQGDTLPFRASQTGLFTCRLPSSEDLFLVFSGNEEATIGYSVTLRHLCGPWLTSALWVQCPGQGLVRLAHVTCCPFTLLDFWLSAHLDCGALSLSLHQAWKGLGLSCCL